MSAVAIQKVNSASKQTLPIFEAIEKQFEAVRRRAFDLFEKRGCQNGQELDDWLKAERELMGAPATELSEKDGVYRLTVALAGFEGKDVEVIATPVEVILHAEASEKTPGKAGSDLDAGVSKSEVYLRMEMPGAIDTEKVEAKFEKGVLQITAPMVGAYDGKQLTTA